MRTIQWDPKIEAGSITVVGPDWMEMARRHLSKARAENFKAEKFAGLTNDYRKYRESAASHFRIAQKCLAEAKNVRHLRDYGRTN